jgi:hypothetical protein
MLSRLQEPPFHLIVMFFGFHGSPHLIVTIIMFCKLLELNPNLIVMIIMLIGFLVFSWWSSLIITTIMLCKLLQELNPSHHCHDHHVY